MIECDSHVLFREMFKLFLCVYFTEMMYRRKLPVMSCNRGGTDSVLKQANTKTVVSIASQLSCHPVRQTRIAVVRPTNQCLIKVD